MTQDIFAELPWTGLCQLCVYIDVCSCIFRIAADAASLLPSTNIPYPVPVLLLWVRLFLVSARLRALLTSVTLRPRQWSEACVLFFGLRPPALCEPSSGFSVRYLVQLKHHTLRMRGSGGLRPVHLRPVIPSPPQIRYCCLLRFGESSVLRFGFCCLLRCTAQD
jgi:hypothetical protein